MIFVVFLPFIFWFTSNLAQWNLSQGGPPASLSYYAFLGFLVLVAIILAVQNNPLLTAQTWQQTQLLWFWLASFVFFVCLIYLSSSQSNIATQKLINWIRSAALFGGLLVVLSWIKTYRPLGLLLGAVCMLGSVMNIYDFIVPTFSSVLGRAAGFYLNPNISGFILLLSLTAALPVLSVPMRWLLVGLTATGIFLTFSRGAWMVLFISTVWWFWQGYFGLRRQRYLIGMVVLMSIALLGYSILSGSLAELVLNSPLEQYLDSNTLARLGLGGFATDNSVSEREEVARFALEQFSLSQNPFLGWGLGYTYEWDMRVSTHNMYLLFLVEGGLMGLAIYLMLLGILWVSSSGIGRLMVFQLAVYSFFTHNLLDSPGRIFFLALIASGFLGRSRFFFSRSRDAHS